MLAGCSAKTHRLSRAASARETTSPSSYCQIQSRGELGLQMMPVPTPQTQSQGREVSLSSPHRGPTIGRRDFLTSSERGSSRRPAKTFRRPALYRCRPSSIEKQTATAPMIGATLLLARRLSSPDRRSRLMGPQAASSRAIRVRSSTRPASSSHSNLNPSMWTH